MKKTIMILTSLILMPLLVLANSGQYMVVDLTGGTTATSYPISYLSGEPEGGWSDEYKTTKLVLRRIEPGTCVVTTDKPYYIGVFEMTQKQYALITGESPSRFSGDTRPVERVTYNAIRGSDQGAQYPKSTDVDTDSFLGKLRARTSLTFDLPTDAQWEYACRAGTTTTYYWGNVMDGNYAWYTSNSSSQSHVVGTRNPNLWGLYDMSGNVWEWCLDYYSDSEESGRLVRGSAWNDSGEYCASSYRSADPPSGWHWTFGFRLVCNSTSVFTPVISPASGTIFDNTSQSVSISCDSENASIRYTIDGSVPTEKYGRIYKGPFTIYQTTTVKAIAVKDDWKDSAVVSATFTKANEIGPAINLLEMLPDNDKPHPWTVVTDVTHDGVSAVKSGEISDDESTTMKVVVYGAGELSFWWRTSCEPAIGGEWYDFATFYDGTTAVTNLAGVTDWQRVVRTVEGTGKHTFKWTYQKDGSGSTVPDGAWVDQVQWLPKTDDWYSDHTLTTEAPVKYDWLRKYGLAIEDDFETAAKAATGKSDGSGRELTVEDDFVAGTDPTNELSHLEATIEMTNGVPLVRWTPDLNEDGSKKLRTYKIWGKETLDDTSDWEYPTNSLHHFFRVTVEMP